MARKHALTIELTKEEAFSLLDALEAVVQRYSAAVDDPEPARSGPPVVHPEEVRYYDRCRALIVAIMEAVPASWAREWDR